MEQFRNTVSMTTTTTNSEQDNTSQEQLNETVRNLTYSGQHGAAMVLVVVATVVAVVVVLILGLSQDRA